MQILVDARYRDPALRACLERRAEERVIGLVCWGTTEQPMGDEGIALFPVSLSDGGEWYEQRSTVRTKNHLPEELLRANGATEYPALIPPLNSGEKHERPSQTGVFRERH